MTGERISSERARGGAEAWWPRLAELPLLIEDSRLEQLEPEASFGFPRVTIQIRLMGGGHEGLGEDISPMPGEENALATAIPSLPLAGEWTLASFCEHLAALEQWPAPPAWEAARRYRNWGYESAALDLALRQAGRSLPEALGIEPRPVRFVNSLRLGEPPSAETIHLRLARYPGLRLKLDAVPAWTPGLMAELAATGAVESIDFKGQYGLEVPDPDALLVLYDRILDTFPDAVLEDPHDLPGVAERLAAHVDRVAYDAPIHGIDDLGATPLPARIANVKPCRVGGLRPLLGLYAHCQAHGIRMYGGGMGEVGVARGQIQLLASLFHPDEPNDVAPVGFNAAEPPEGLPSSPLEPRPDAIGFRRAA
jgi:L-alanine-DL-glutamate epimerase-like enolase superfamily enzyme